RSQAIKPPYLSIETHRQNGVKTYKTCPVLSQLSSSSSSFTQKIFQSTIILTMFASRVIFALVAGVVAVTSVSANTGYATHDNQGIRKCPIACPGPQPTKYQVALPSDQFPDFSRCCSTVRVSYEGKNIDTVFTGLYDAGAHTQNISLNDAAFNLLAPLTVDKIFPVVWNI
ncbi:hypothetical protein CVT25_001979, partial [Psilocybe cyanescens]